MVTIDIMADASGAPATVRVGGLLWACDWIGGPRVRLINATGRRVPRWVPRAAEGMYARELRARVSDDWFAANAVMYAANGG